MSNLKFSPLINRLIRQDSPEALGKPTRPFIEAAIKSYDAAAAEQWLDYYLNEHGAVQNIYFVWNWYMVQHYLKQEPNSTLQSVLQVSMAGWVGTTAGLKNNPVAQVITDGANAQIRVDGLHWSIHIIEDEKRYLVSLDTPEAQTARRNEWRSAINRAIKISDLHSFTHLLESYLAEAQLIHDIVADWAWSLLTVFVNQWGEDSLTDVLRVTEEPWVSVRYSNLKDMTQEESLQLTVEGMRGHFTGQDRAGVIQIADEPDRWVMSFDACGSGGRMRRGDPMMGSGSRLGAPYNFANIEGSFDWTWQQNGVCAYCAHCAVVNQILPIEGLGYPMRMVEYPTNANDPCRWIIYKDTNQYPPEAYTNVGKSPIKK
ncbi:MAG: hypothetical protein R3E39_08250 [Anaerolineae bacterium]